MAVIEHPPGEETQCDWVELPDPPAHWGWGSKAYLLVGALAHSGRWRGVLAESDGPAAPDRRAAPGLRRGLGGLTRTWRFDRMATVCHPAHGPGHRLVRRGRQALRGVGGDLPAAAREPQGRGGEGQPHRRATLVAHPGRRRARSSRPRLAWTGGARCAATPGMRPTGDGKATVATVAARRAAAPPLPAPFPAVLTVAAGRLARRRWSPSAATTTRCHPSWPAPGHRRRTGSARTDIDSPPAAGIVIARHRLAPAGAGATVRDTGHVTALERAALAAFTDRRTAPPQATHPTRPGRPSRRRGPARRPHRTDTVHNRHRGQPRRQPRS